MAGTPEENLFLAQIAEQAELYSDICTYMKRVAEVKKDLSADERNLLSVGFKNTVSSLRQALRTVRVAEGEGSCPPDAIAAYKAKLQGEFDKTTGDILNLLDGGLIAAAADAEGQVFLHKMKGDYLRYQSEFATDANKADVCQKAAAAYESALQCANALPQLNTTRLGLVLNYSVFYYETMREGQKAIDLAQGALDASSNADGISEEALGMLQLLAENLQLWKGGDANDDGTGVEDM